MDINMFRADHGGNPAVLKESQRRRGADVQAVDDVIELDRKWKEAQFHLDRLKAEARRVGKIISERKKKREDISDLVKDVAARQPEIESLEPKVKHLLEQRDARLLAVGNVLHPSVPVGGASHAKTVIRTHQADLVTPPSPLDYSDVLHRLGAHDGEHSGLLRGVGVILHQALLSFAANFLVHHNCNLVSSPMLVPKHIAQLIADDPTKLHCCVTSGPGAKDLCFATADETLLSLHEGEWLEEGTLPRRYASIVTCIPEMRQPYKGYYGQDQVEAVRLVWFVEPEESFAALDNLLALCETFYQQYRVVAVPSSATSRAAAKEVRVAQIDLRSPKPKYEIECLLPGTKHHRALARISNLTDYRSRQLAIRYGPKKQGDLEKRHAAIVSAQLFAVPPLICTILEQHQSVDGVKVPASLRPFVPQPTLPYTSVLPVSK